MAAGDDRRVRQRPAAPEDDATVKLPRRRSYGRPANTSLFFPAGGGMPPIIRAVALVLVLVAGVVGWFTMREPVDEAERVLALTPQTAAVPAIAVRLAGEAAIQAHQAEVPTPFRLLENTQILVIDFPTLLAQGRMMNRLAALVEKRGQPRDRVLNDAELDAAIAAANETMETYYYGHDYPAAALERFFALADRQGLVLRPEEEWLRRLLRQEDMLKPGARGALISVPRAGAAPGVDAGLRAAILRHELSHGEYFSNRAYAEYARRFWHTVLDDAGRAAFRTYLAGQDYDPADEDLMVNEMQAYLMHTPDTRMFNPAAFQVAPERIAAWQEEFLLGMPTGWLRDAAVRQARPAIVPAAAR